MTTDTDWCRDLPVVVTGGMGFIGSNLALRLESLGARVTLIDKMLTDYGANPQNIADPIRVNRTTPPLQVIEADIGATALIEKVVSEAKVIFNIAGQTSHMDSMKDPLEDMRLNQESNLRFLDLIRRVNPTARVVFSSTRQFYGAPRYLPVDEDHPINPPDINGVHKFAAESYHMLYAKIYGMRTTALRLTNVFGPRMRIRDAKQTFLGIWVRHAVEGTRFEVWGGDQLRDFSYVEDLVDALLATAHSDASVGHVYNLGGCPAVSLLDLAELLVRIAGSGSFERKIFPEERKKIDIGDYYCDDTPFRTATGWQPHVDLEEGLRRTIAYYRANAEHYL
ncbi:NAD-dependent epimerase/dehydratase family protein [Oceanibaculum nanhaiense]|uniref:NAD-dependent epimerase/dehydratase family protein n=1 Tax=Oceanibaculum nanhaiense TaxID=1909734 RepID=UPI003D26CA14